MRKRLKTILTFLLLTGIASILSWHSSLHMNRVYKPVKVGVSAGPHFEIMSLVKKIVEKDGIDLQIIVFNDYSKLNESLYRGDILLNSFQHRPYLEKVLSDHHYEISPIAKTILFPMGIYSKKVNRLDALPPGSSVAIPRDLWNGSRALLLLEKAGLIVCQNPTSPLRTLDDVIKNPKNLTFIQMDAMQIGITIHTAAIALINANYAVKIGLEPAKDAILLEDEESPYVNLLVAANHNTANTDLQKIAAAYHSQEVKNFVNSHFQGTAIATW